MGNVILEIEDEKIDDIDDYYSVIEKLKKEDKESVLFYVLTGKNYYHYVAVKIK